jgi:hypothetical protein
LSKVWKKAKKVVKAVAPIAVNFIPGPWAPFAISLALKPTVAGKASGLSTKEADVRNWRSINVRCWR